MSAMRLGFIGLGAMGRPMALHLLRAGHEVAVWARRPQSALPLLDAGAVCCATPADVARRAEVVFTGKTGDRPLFSDFCFGENRGLSVRSNSSKSSGLKSRLGSCPYAPVA